MKLILPLEVYLPRKTKKDRKIRLNKNVERNLNRFVYKAAKYYFSQSLHPQICTIPPVREFPVKLTFKFFHGSNRKVDLDNYSVVVKFAIDALKDHKLIPEDDTSYIQDIQMLWGGVDIGDPRAELTITKL